MGGGGGGGGGTSTRCPPASYPPVMGFFEEEHRRSELPRIKDGLYVVILALGYRIANSCEQLQLLALQWRVFEALLYSVRTDLRDSAVKICNAYSNSVLNFRCYRLSLYGTR